MRSQLLYDLTNKLQGIPLRIIAEVYFGYTKDPTRNAKRIVAALEKKGLVCTYSYVIPRIDPASVAEPLFKWAPSDDSPHGTSYGSSWFKVQLASVTLDTLKEISHRLSTRFDGLDTYSETFVTATRDANSLYGGYCGYGRHIRAVDATHDFVRAAAFFSLPERQRKRWQAEEALVGVSKFWAKAARIPDAIIRGRTRNDDILIDVGGTGAYRPERLLEWHTFCEFRGNEYWIW